MVADADVLPGDLVGVVERRPRDGRARELRRPQFRDRRQDARAPDLDGDRLDDRLRALRLVLVGARPAGTVRRRAQDAVKSAFVDLDDGAVDLEAEGMPQRQELVDRRIHLVQRLHVLRPRRDGEAPGPERGDHLRMRGESVAADAAGIVDDDVEGTLRRHLRIELFERTRAGVARVRELLEPGRSLALVERDEALARHVRLAADFELARRALGERLGNRRDGPHVGRNVVPDHAVATSRRPHEASVRIPKRKRDAVDLGLDRVSEARHRLADEGVELGEFPLGVRLVERLHRRVVRDLGEALADAARDPADGGGFAPELGILVLEP